MRLIIGGAGQGKLDYALQAYGYATGDVAQTFSEAGNRAIFTEFQQAVKTVMSRGEDPQALTAALLRENPEVIILCDEVGCGVVPIDRSERLWRETVGRLCCALAREAITVERVFCGIPMVLKGEKP